MVFARSLLRVVGLGLSIAVVACKAPVADERGVQGTPFCRRIRGCLQEKLPKQYVTSMHDAVLEQAAQCLGHDTKTVWTTHDCLPFEFARDEHDVGVEVAVDCTELCPMNASIMLRYAEPVSALECECMGAVTRLDAAFGSYERCVPAPSEPLAQRLSVRQSAWSERFEVTAQGALSELLGLNQAVLSIDGQAVRTPDVLEQAVSSLPRALPGAITLSAGQGVASTQQVVLHYPAREVFEELSQLAREVDFEHLGPQAAACAFAGDDGIRLGERFVPFDRQCDKPVTQKLMRLAARIERAAAEAQPRRLSPERAVSCKELRGQLSSVALREHGKLTELRYVDWLAR